MITVEQLEKYYVGRRNPFVYQTDDGSPRPVRGTINTALLTAHVAGEETYGTYTINEDGKVRCVTWDIDSGNWFDALAIVGAARKYGLKPCVWTSGRKGYHVIVSFDPPIHSAAAYALGLKVKADAGLPDIESFPKQAELTLLKPYGNLTRLPGGVHKVTGTRSKLVLGDVEYSDVPDVAIEIPKNQGPSEWNKTWLTDLFNGETPDGGNNMLYRFRGWLESRGFPPDLVRYNIEYINNEIWEDPMDQRELDRTVLRGL